MAELVKGGNAEKSGAVKASQEHMNSQAGFPLSCATAGRLRCALYTMTHARERVNCAAALQ